MLAHELRGHSTTTSKGNIDELATGGLLDRHCDDLVFLLGTRSGHLLGAAGLLHVIQVFLGGFVRGVCMNPENELVEGEHRDRGEVFPVEGHTRAHGGCEEIREGDDDFVGIALCTLHIEEALGTSTAALVQNNDGLLHQVVLDHNALHKTGHLVCATTGSCGDHKLNGLAWLPGGRDSKRCGNRCCHHRNFDHALADGRENYLSCHLLLL